MNPDLTSRLKGIQNFEDTIHSINNSKTNKKNASKNNVVNNSSIEDYENVKGRNKEREEGTDLGDKSIKDNVDVENFVQKDKVNEKGFDAIKDDETSESNNVSYANMVKKDEVPKNLNYIPTMVTDSEVVIFNEMLVKKEVKEAWSMDGISALASSLGKPMMMDTMTANMCYKGVGNLEYARNLVKMDTEKELKKEIEIQYRDHNNNIKGSKKVKVVYDWKPPACTTCKVFGHDGTRNDAGKALATHNYTHNQRHNKGDVNWREPEFRGHEYRKRQVDVAGTKKSKDDNHVMKNKWNVKDKEVDELIRTANKYYVLKFLPKDNDQELRMLKEKMIVDKFLDKKVQPILIESIYWLKDMIRYLKEKWEKDRPLEMNVESEEAEVEDVINISSGSVKVIGENEGKPWSIARDMNVTLYPNEHTYGTSVMNVDMMEFQDSLNEIEVEDIWSSSLYFTWTKNLHKAKVGIMTGILKKLERVMSNKEFINQFSQLKGVQSAIDVDPHNQSVSPNKAKLVEEFYEAKDGEQIPQVSLKHFEEFLGTSHPMQEIKSIETLFKRRLRIEEADKMIGRLQLIVVVLESIHVYLASVFLLPGTIIKEINRLLKCFLWNRSETTKGKAKVDWSTICRPKDQGGLGLKNLQIWNQALLGKHVWNIAIKKDTLWGWKNLLGIRDQIKNSVVYKIGNGNNTSLWFDNWSNIGPLFQYITHRDLYDERLNGGLKVSEMIVNEKWASPNDWFEKFQLITRLDVPIVDAQVEDKIVWRTNNGNEVDFSVRHVNFDLNRQSPIVQWWKLSMHMPEIKVNVTEWKDIIQALIDTGNGNNINSVIRILVLAANVYNILYERNRRIFQNIKRNGEEVFKSIIEVVKSKLIDLTIKDSCADENELKAKDGCFFGWFLVFSMLLGCLDPGLLGPSIDSLFGGLVGFSVKRSYLSQQRIQNRPNSPATPYSYSGAYLYNVKHCDIHIDAISAQALYVTAPLQAYHSGGSPYYEYIIRSLLSNEFLSSTHKSKYELAKFLAYTVFVLLFSKYQISQLALRD
ncbi:hypothetical protein Tco_0629196 [Tanacetum coccineum]|uniref:Reverse transcriptase zinc-binding domain-containing protein n=1 Tax=Tanacetum coccineum TaxID=301880 RepID=A0ABQ4WSG4_9ASTR